MRRLHLAFVALGDHSYEGLVVDEFIHLPAVFIAQRLGAPMLAVYGSAALATLGHNFSPVHEFRGGKGAATVIGISALMSGNSPPKRWCLEGRFMSQLDTLSGP